MPGLARSRPGALRDTETRDRESIAQLAMRGFDQHALGMGAEKIAPDGAVRRPRPDIDGVRDQLLAVAAARLQPQRAARKADRTFVSVGRDVTDVVDHARPVSFSGRLALGPCGK